MKRVLRVWENGEKSDFLTKNYEVHFLEAAVKKYKNIHLT